MTGWRILWWSLTVVGVGAAIGLSVLVMVGDLDTASQLASVVGAVAGVVASAVSVYAMFGTPASQSAQIRARDGSNAAGGSIRNASARDTTPAPATPDSGGGKSASGGSNAAGGDMDGNTAYKGP
ncbi:hypothetical protein [Streptomyces sp. NBC_00258]|uniref:hypothetical protein n=1 Tax=Streptomyces sp. NBC_00258 TaxID=2903642 RepID=UPI002E29E4BF|nr:hypothetical protein [Streptomyces sp. NBC_00258]